jgi:superfamily II DNA helicase RecQ
MIQNPYKKQKTTPRASLGPITNTLRASLAKSSASTTTGKENNRELVFATSDEESSIGDNYVGAPDLEPDDRVSEDDRSLHSSAFSGPPNRASIDSENHSDVASTENNNSEDENKLDASVLIFRVTPVGVFCSICSKKVGISRNVLSGHLKKHNIHAQNHSVVHRQVTSELARLRQTVAAKEVFPDDSELVKRWECVVCCFPFATSQSFAVHRSVQKKKGGRCASAYSTEVMLRKSIYGVCPTAPLMPPNPSRHPRESRPLGVGLASGKNKFLDSPCDFKKHRATLEKYVRDDEDVDVYLPLFLDTLKSFEHFDSDMLDLVNSYSDSKQTNPSLDSLLDEARDWLFDRACVEVAVIPANYRAKLLKFDNQELGEITLNLTYTFRHKESALWQELRPLLQFASRFSHELEYWPKTREELLHPFAVPRILMSLALQKTKTLRDHPVVYRYCLSRAFVKHGQGIAMKRCGGLASICASVLSLLRAGICSVLYSLDHSGSFAIAAGIVKAAGFALVPNLISPFIRRLRDMQRRKHISRLVTVSPEGNIAVDGFEFLFDCWRMLIPKLQKKCIELLEKLFIGDEWKKIIDPSVVLFVNRRNSGELEFSSTTVKWDAITPRLDVASYDKFVSFLELGLQGFGFGATRRQEILRQRMVKTFWHRGTIYLSKDSIKQYTHKTAQSKSVTQKFPTCFSRLLLLNRRLVQVFFPDQTDLLIVPRQESKLSLCDAVADLFGFETNPDVNMSRHLFAGIANIKFPHGAHDSLILVADEEASEQFGHSQATQRSKYGTVPEVGRKELSYRTWHQSMGDADFSPVAPSQDIDESDLLTALRFLFGPTASYRNELQRRVVAECSNFNSGNHAFVALPCGSGKSLTWLLPPLASALTGKERVAVVVVLPYKFLALYHLNHAREIMVQNVDISIMLYTGKDIHSTWVPEEFVSGSVLPDITFLTLEACEKLMTHHFARVKKWPKERRVRFVVDEVHTILCEEFRPAYSSLSRLAAVEAPVSLLSGSVPQAFITPLLRKLNLSFSHNHTLGDINYFEGGDVFGAVPSNFSFQVKVTKDPISLAMERVIRLTSRDGSPAVHVLVSNKADGSKLINSMPDDLSCALITADTDFGEQETVSSKWKAGDISVLISTTSGLVGNESRRCRHVIIVGLLHNMLNVTQAMGRLRPDQRAGGSIQFFIPTTERLDTVDEQENISYDLLKGQELIQSREIFDRFLSVHGVKAWLLDSSSCYFKRLSVLFGCPERNDCLSCDYCRNTPVAKAAYKAREEHAAFVKLEQDAVMVLSRMEQFCPICASSRCNGESCRERRDPSCLNCGSSGCRNRRDCVSTCGRILRGRACFKCFDFDGRKGSKSHQSGQCPLELRLRRLLQESAKRKQKNFHNFLAETYSSKKSFYSCLVFASSAANSNK